MNWELLERHLDYADAQLKSWLQRNVANDAKVSAHVWRMYYSRAQDVIH